jgi:predicted enzyme related to lactoylglutathione lyase
VAVTAEKNAAMTDRPIATFGLVLDCADPERLAGFWTAALDYVNVGSAGAYVALYPRERSGPKLLLQRVDEPKTSKNRMHIDIETPDIHTEATRLAALGAQRVSDGPCNEHGSTWILMADPEGNEFCICDNGNPAAVKTHE